MFLNSTSHIAKKKARRMNLLSPTLTWSVSRTLSGRDQKVGKLEVLLALGRKVVLLFVYLTLFGLTVLLREFMRRRRCPLRQLTTISSWSTLMEKKDTEEVEGITYSTTTTEEMTTLRPTATYTSRELMSTLKLTALT